MTIRRLLCPAIYATALVVLSSAGDLSAQTPAGAAPGVTLFSLYCASCHGASAKGDGPFASMLTKRPADLTQIARRNGGTFQSDQVARIIDGRRPVKGHGGGDMPIWGDAFAKSVGPESVDERIRRLVAYLETIQSKP